MSMEVYITSNEVRAVQAARVRMQKYQRLDHTQRAFLVLSGDNAAAQYRKDCEMVSAYQLKYWSDKKLRRE